jgi:hypothetical protein
MAKQYGIKMNKYWELVEVDGNLMGVAKKQKFSLAAPPFQNPKEKKFTPEPSHWLHAISICKTVYHDFQLGQVPPSKR